MQSTPSIIMGYSNDVRPTLGKKGVRAIWGVSGEEAYELWNELQMSFGLDQTSH